MQKGKEDIFKKYTFLANMHAYFHVLYKASIVKMHNIVTDL